MNSKEARVEARLTKEQKALFERAAHLGGYGSLSHFMVSTMQEKAKEIVDDWQKFMQNEKDRETFFDALENPPEPNEALKRAAQFFADSQRAGA